MNLSTFVMIESVLEKECIRRGSSFGWIKNSPHFLDGYKVMLGLQVTGATKDIPSSGEGGEMKC